jgi:hypothetical protein
VFTVNPQKSGREVWGYAFVDPHYGDLLSHRHRSYRLSAKPAGTPVYDTMDTASELGTAVVLGYPPDAVRGGEFSDCNDPVIPLLRLSGEWPARDSVMYTVWLSRSYGTDREASPAPSSDFSDVWLHWSSSDPEEGSGEARVEAFYKPVAIGDRGLMAELDIGFMEDLSSPYSVESDDVGLRTWTVRMPDAAKGWASNVTESDAAFGDATVAVYGVSSGRANRVFVYTPDCIFALPSELPAAGDTMIINDTAYEFVDADSDDPPEGVVPVPIQATAYKTYRNIAHPLDDTGSAIVASDFSTTALVGASSATYNGSPMELVANGGGTLSGSSGTLNAMVCDENGASLADEGYVEFNRLSLARRLSNGLSMYVRASGEVSIPAGASAELDTYNGCPGASFRYNIEMDEDFNSEYPPVPAKSGSLMWNGVELESDEHFGKTAVYSIGPDSLYWYDNVVYRTPWPRELLDSEEDVDLSEMQRLVFHYVSSFHSETGPVTSLRPAPGSPITVKRCGTLEDASVGDLELDVDLLSDVFDSEEAGYKAVKASKHGKLLLGPMVERIVAGPGIDLQQSVGQPKGQGTVTISATNAMYAGEMDTIALENAKEEMIGMFPYIRLLGWNDGSGNIPTGFVAKFQIPFGIPDDVYKVKLYATVFGEESFSGQSGRQMAGVSMTYSILPDWTPISGRGLETASLNLKSDLISPDSPLSVDIPFGTTNGTSFEYKAFDPVLIHNDPSIENMDGRSYDALGNPMPSDSECSGYLSSHVIGTSAFGVRPGYIVAVKFSRTAPSSGTPYIGRIGFINLRWSLSRAMSDEVVTTTSGIDVDTILRGLRRTAMVYNSTNVRSVEQIRIALLSILNKLR